MTGIQQDQKQMTAGNHTRKPKASAIKKPSADGPPAMCLTSINFILTGVLMPS